MKKGEGRGKETIAGLSITETVPLVIDKMRLTMSLLIQVETIREETSSPF